MVPQNHQTKSIKLKSVMMVKAQVTGHSLDNEFKWSRTIRATLGLLDAHLTMSFRGVVIRCPMEVVECHMKVNFREF